MDRRGPTGPPAVTYTRSGKDLVALVHGGLGRGVSFDRVAAHLEDECWMLWYDRRGYAGSIQAEPPDVDGHVDDLVAILAGRPPSWSVTPSAA